MYDLRLMSDGQYSSLLDAFPQKYRPRQIQRDILEQIDEKLSSGYKKIILSAPTGVGKSLIAAAVAQYFDDSFIVTASKHLQDQYSQDLDFLKPIKGKSNFSCLKLMEQEKIQSISQAKRLGLTCEKGQCVEKVKKNSNEQNDDQNNLKSTDDTSNKGRAAATTVVIEEEPCSFKPKITDVKAGKYIEGSTCLYYLQKYLGLVASHSLWNYSSYFQIMKYNKKLFADYLGREIAIFDEAHKIEDQIIQFAGFDIYNTTLEECGLDPRAYNFDDIESMITLTDSIADYYANAIRQLEENPAFQENPDQDAMARLESRYKRASDARIEMVENPENFVINNPEYGINGGFRSVSIKPLDISKYIKDFFQTPHQVFMSATIDKPSFCENTGIELDDVAVVDAPKSPFLLENRRIEFLNTRRLNSRSTDDDKLAIVAQIDKIMTQRSSQRGLILTSSISWCEYILQNLSKENSQRIRICHSKNPNGQTQDQILDEHAGTTGSVLLSSSLWEGVDLKDDLSRFQIIAKVPYPNLSEKRIGKKMKQFPLWYDSQTLMKLLQGFGRSIRNEQDWAHTYILDSSVHHILNKAKSRIPRAYYDVLGWN